MAGTIQGGLNAAATNKLRYGEDFYARIGKSGGALGKTGGFAYQGIGADGLTGKERARVAGKLGGERSRRNKIKPLEELKIEKRKWINRLFPGRS